MFLFCVSFEFRLEEPEEKKKKTPSLLRYIWQTTNLADAIIDSNVSMHRIRMKNLPYDPISFVKCSFSINKRPIHRIEMKLFENSLKSRRFRLTDTKSIDNSIFYSIHKFNLISNTNVSVLQHFYVFDQIHAHACIYRLKYYCLNVMIHIFPPNRHHVSSEIHNMYCIPANSSHTDC